MDAKRRWKMVGLMLVVVVAAGLITPATATASHARSCDRYETVEAFGGAPFAGPWCEIELQCWSWNRCTFEALSRSLGYGWVQSAVAVSGHDWSQGALTCQALFNCDTPRLRFSLAPGERATVRCAAAGWTTAVMLSLHCTTLRV